MSYSLNHHTIQLRKFLHMPRNRKMWLTGRRIIVEKMTKTALCVFLWYRIQEIQGKIERWEHSCKEVTVKERLFDDTKSRLDTAAKMNTVENINKDYPKSSAETGLPQCNSAVVKNSLAVQETRVQNHWVGKIPWRREWRPIPVFVPGEFYGQRSLGGYSP